MRAFTVLCLAGVGFAQSYGVSSECISAAIGLLTSDFGNCSQIANVATYILGGSSPTSLSSAAVSADSSTSASPTGACTGNELVCSSDGYSFSICSNGQLVPFGSVATGTQCINGQIVVDTASGASQPGSCSGDQLVCSSDGNSFARCSNGQLIPFGPVAAGTQCVNGQIVAKPVSRRALNESSSLVDPVRPGLV